jgi:hypothetical protein
VRSFRGLKIVKEIINNAHIEKKEEETEKDKKSQKETDTHCGHWI